MNEQTQQPKIERIEDEPGTINTHALLTKLTNIAIEAPAGDATAAALSNLGTAINLYGKLEGLNQSCDTYDRERQEYYENKARRRRREAAESMTREFTAGTDLHAGEAVYTGSMKAEPGKVYHLDPRDMMEPAFHAAPRSYWILFAFAVALAFVLGICITLAIQFIALH